MITLLLALASSELNLTDPPTFPDDYKPPAPPGGVLDDEFTEALEKRTCSDVCSRFNNSWMATATTKWTGSTSGCDLGNYSNAALKDAQNRMNYYRWLGGITNGNVTFTEEKNLGCMRCAVILDANNIVTGSPGATNKCWTSTGQSYCQVSLVTLAEDASAAVRAYYDSAGVGSLANRRWILFPPLNTMGMGQRNRGNALQVVNTDYVNTRVLPYMAVPGPGGFPIDILPKDWSFSSNVNMYNATVSIKRSDGKTVSCSVDDKYAKTGLWGMSTIRIHSMPSDLIEAGYTYEVEVKVGSNKWEYTTTLHDCGKPCVSSTSTPTPKPSATSSGCDAACQAKVKEFVSKLKTEFNKILDQYL